MKAKWIIVIAMCVCLVAAFSASLHVLQIAALREGKIVFVRIIHPGERFATKYIHSVEKCPVWEFFRVDERFQIVVYETTFSSCNTGLPSAPQGDEQFRNEGNQFRLSHMHRVLPALRVWVHDRYENTMKYGNSEVLMLPSLAGNTLLEIAVRQITVGEFLYRKMRLFLENS